MSEGKLEKVATATPRPRNSRGDSPSRSAQCNVQGSSTLRLASTRCIYFSIYTLMATRI
ncbi:hypothetical protein CPB84DRAFT_1791508 [Gymnopilus junonius]|uniref:Uncharacterized protein n=1 Tax=Gymnopilus junonius TaxID=109634 RepID=A0A9P5NDW5_GYMJU|nr:hypothetical protein CPB84DRAFT_1791508 [Gymnopilus junonius]